MRKLGGVALLLFLSAANLQAQDAKQVDKLFERFSGNTPGCAVGAIQNGETLVAKAYGTADLEHNTPLSPESRFYMASVSKQFTAMAVLLLAEDGVLNIRDSLRKTIPEMPAYADRITLYNLLTHTSGIRDYLSLGGLAGRRPDYVYNDDNTLRLIARQAGLNFQPGAEFLYSNSGYVLLSLVVKRLTHKNLDEFAQERIFRPLEMKATRFQHDHTAFIPDKALGHERGGNGWRLSNSTLDVVGDGGLYSSVQDMLRWAANFDNIKVGGNALTIMQTPGVLRNGKKTSYGMGLAPSKYRGLPTVEHSGALAGYRTEFLRFPEQKLSVVCLCNNNTANPSQLARQVAEIYLSSRMKAAADPKPSPASATPKVTEASVSLEEVRGKTGLYKNDAQGYLEFTEKDGKLYADRAPTALVALDKQRFTLSDAPGSEIRFDMRTPPASVQVKFPGEPSMRFQRVNRVALSQQEIQAYTGNFVSDELETTYRISANQEGLIVKIGERPPMPLASLTRDHMRAPAIDAEITFDHDRSGQVTGFKLEAGRVREILFNRVK